ncbi:RagB/SusD family nutrient uptake outer membrane protein [Prolixibacteraceae bacterium JC049]|nr:RagB/SusD family nutrient uptake outer membrane protein [Prolixibacteraceae bacterium JC049]
MKIIKYILLLTLSVQLIGCDDFFEQDKEDIIAGNKHFKTREDITNTIVGISGLMQDAVEQNIIVQSLLSDEIVLNDFAPEQFFQIESRKTNEDNKYANASAFYKVIVNCNNLLSQLDTVKIQNTGFTHEQALSIINQTAANRAWAYLNMGHIFGKVRYFTDPLIEFKEEKIKQFPEYTFDELLPILIADLEEKAKETGSIDWGKIMGDNDNEWNMVKIPLNVILGNLYLEANQYNEAINAYFAYLAPLSEDKYILPEKYDWSNKYDGSINSATKDIISAIPFSKTKMQQHELQTLFSDPLFRVGEGGKAFLLPTDTLLNSYKNQENIYDELGDDRMHGSILHSEFLEAKMIYKYTIGRRAYDNDAHIILYRAADIHLALAECFNRLEMPKVALALINNGVKEFWLGEEWDSEVVKDYAFPKQFIESEGVRSSQLLKPRMLDEESTKSKIQQIEEIIADEYLLEMAYEAKRWPMLTRIAKRWIQDNGAEGATFLADRIATKSEIAKQRREDLMKPENWYLKY